MTDDAPVPVPPWGADALDRLRTVLVDATPPVESLSIVARWDEYVLVDARVILTPAQLRSLFPDDPGVVT